MEREVSTEQLMAAQKNANVLKPYMNMSQAAVIRQGFFGEEGEYFENLLQETADTVSKMPALYEQDGKGGEAIVHLHYFVGACDWYITEVSISEGNGRLTAFGYVDLGMGFPELGYIDMEELTSTAAQMDLHWTAKTLNEVKRERGE